MALNLMCTAAVAGIACYLIIGTVPKFLVMTFVVCAAIVLF